MKQDNGSNRVQSPTQQGTALPDAPCSVFPCMFCGFEFDHEYLGRYGCPNCEGEGLEKIRVLVACEYSARVRDAFRAKGADAWSCDFEPCEGDPEWHHQGDCRDIIGDDWDIMIAHPPCTYLASSGMHWTSRGLRDPQLTEDALEFVRMLLDAPIHHIALENPVGCISTRIRPPDVTVQPWMFGDPESKATCFWLKNLPPLVATHAENDLFAAPLPLREVEGRWNNQTDSGQNKLAPSKDRWKERSRTYTGIANAMADQWFGFLSQNA